MGRRILNSLLAVSLSLGATGVVHGQSESSDGSPAPTPAPMLARLSAETQALYDQVRPGIIRVHLPPTRWAQPQPSQQQGDPLDKWKEKLDPEVRAKIAEAQARSATGGNVEVTAQIAPASTQPSTQPNTLVAQIAPRLQVAQRLDGGLELLAFSSSDPGAGAYDAEMPSVGLKVIGVLIDGIGHVLVPMYIEGGAIGGEPLRISTGSGQVATATFVGSDRQTNLTVLKLTEPIGRPVPVTGGRPADGSLVMVLSPGGDAGKLSVWTGGQQDRGIVVRMDGGVAGFARYGQFLCGVDAQPVVDQLVKHGRVRRATLGVLVEETETPDGRRAMRLEKVMPDTPAQQVDLREGDFILSIGGAPVSDLPSFAAAIAARDGETELEVLRGAKTFKVTVMLKQK